jgi:putative DNA primase/helicase
MNTIKYTTKINSTDSDVKIVSCDKYEELCKNIGCYEVIPDDENVKLYFDIDYKQPSDMDAQDYDETLFGEILSRAIEVIQKFCIEKYNQPNPSYTICQSNSSTIWKISIHIIVENVIATKKSQRLIVDELNNYAKKFTDVNDYMPGLELFDTSVYSSKRKMRSLCCSKPNEDRPLILHSGTFEGHCISAFIPEDAVVYHVEPEVVPYVAPSVVTETDSDEDYNIFNAFIEAGLLSETCKKSAHNDWIKVGYAFINVLGKERAKILFYKLTLEYGTEHKKEDVEARFTILCVDKDRNEKCGRLTVINYAKKVDANKVKEINKKYKKVIPSGVIDEKDTFKYIASEFEKNHCKIINKSIFVKITNEKTVLMSLKQLETAYAHISYKDFNEFGKMEKFSFIKRWVSHTHDIRRYEDMDVYPNPLRCPSYILNMWSPFACEKLITPYEKNEKGLKCILNHIKILCDNDEIVYDYFIKWIAQMIQYPDVKTVCITLISAEGSGKGTLMRLIQRMMGNDKYYETSKPSRDVWGDFNAIMKDTFFVNLNELSKKETLQAEGVIKTLITDEAMTINQKGVSQYTVKSYHRFIVTTNNDDPIKTKKGDRRNLIIRSSDEKKGDNEYFDMLNDYLDDMNVIRTCYDYFKSIEGMDNFRSIKLPTTEYQEDMKGMNESPIEQWLKYFVEQNCELESITLSSGRVYDTFKNWCEINKVNYDVTSVKFAVRLKNLKINGIEKGQHTKNGNTVLFDIKKLKIYFNIGNLVECQETDCCLY